VSTGGKNFRGDPMPTWVELPQPIRTAWEVAVREAADVAAGVEADVNRWAGWVSPSVTKVT
jgi:hypothetical protein